MKKIKVFGITLLVASLVFSAGNVYSQQNSKKTPEERAGKTSEKMKEKLSLSDEQQKQVYDIMLNHFNEMGALKNSTEDKTARREKVKALRESTHSNINSILNSDQQAKLEKFIQERKQKHKDGKCRKHGKHQEIK
jgi:uncharacterized protein YycO